MLAFKELTAVAAPLVRDNIDTDAIIPSREIKSVSKSGLAGGLFAGWRYRSADGRTPDPKFVLNDPAYHGAQILLAGENFGCGSSREHAVWALAEYGFRVFVAPSFSPIFYRNCLRNGLLPARLALPEVGEIAAWVARDPQGNRLSVNLGSCEIRAADGKIWQFSIGEDARYGLLHGLDEIDQTLKMSAAIAAFRNADRQARPWVYELNGSQPAAAKPADGG
jgi:3-isopropylmalate/(R)-2-methylmalate dehydratase small subunit